MLRTALKRGAVSFLIGLGVSQVVNIVISLGLGNGGYISVMPDFAALFPNELCAVVAQAALTGLLGAVFAMASVFFMMDGWSFPRRCAAHFLVTAAVWIPVVWLVWTPRALTGLLIAALNFALTYIIVWAAQVAVDRRLARRINEKIRSKESQP